MDALTERERDILRLIATGLSNKNIAQQLVLSVGTVKWYNKQIYSKLGVSNRTQATLRAREMGLVVHADDLPTPQKNNLPTQITPFIGRETEMDTLRDLFQTERFVSIIGPGGIGKTRLAIDFARRYGRANGVPVWFVPLAPLSNADDALYAIAGAIGFTLRDGENLRQPLLDYLSNKRFLLVLDNFEHILSASELVLAILRAAPNLRILVTSRIRLSIYGEVVFMLKGLALEENEIATYSDAVRLFMDRAWRGQSQQALSAEDITSAIEICRLVEGMPLAVELAASWVHALSISEISAQIKQGIDILRSEQQGLDTRHWSIRAVFAHTWEMLSEQERDTLMRLSVFRGGFESDAAAAVAAADFDVLAALTSHSVIQRDEGGRYYMHGVLRQYVAEHLERAGGTDAAYQKHADFLIALAEQLGPFYGDVTHIVGKNVRRLVREMNNLRELVGWSLTHDQGRTAAELIFRCVSVLQISGYSIEALGWMLAVREKLSDVDLARQTIFEAITVSFASGACRYALALELGRSALALARQAGDRYCENINLYALGDAWMHLGDFAQADQFFDAGIQGMRESGYPVSVACGLQYKGLLAELRNDTDQALAFTRESFAQTEALGTNRPDYATNYGRALWNQRDYQGGIALQKLAFERALENGDLITAMSLGYALCRICWIYLDDAFAMLRLSTAANHVLERLGITWSSESQAIMLKTYRQLFDDDAVDEALALAESLTVDDVIAMTSDLLDRYGRLPQAEIDRRERDWLQAYGHYAGLL